jgi:hypothetical protein
MFCVTPSRFPPSSPIHDSPYGSIGVSLPKARATVVSRKGGICGGHLPKELSMRISLSPFAICGDYPV